MYMPLKVSFYIFEKCQAQLYTYNWNICKHFRRTDTGYSSYSRKKNQKKKNTISTTILFKEKVETQGNGNVCVFIKLLIYLLSVGKSRM